jgi:alanine racemase
MKAAHPTWIEIDVTQFRKNLQTIRNFIKSSRLCLPVKANAYGHGLVEMARAAEDLVDCFAVSCLQEGVLLREAAIQAPILVLGSVHEDQITDLARYDLEFSISSKYKAEIAAKILPKKSKVHLEVDTGMQRTGVRAATAVELVDYLKRQSCFEVVGVYSHLATSNDPESPIALRQIREFKSLISLPSFQNIQAHLANSGGVVHYKDAHLDMVRPGLLAYGYLPDGAPKELSSIAPCFSLKSKISYFKVVEADVGIGYGHTYRTKEQTRIITIPVGYGDGYLRAHSNRGSVLVRGKKYPIAGAVCMDQFMVDVGKSEAYVGDEVVLVGKQGDLEISLREIAGICNTIVYEILCLFNNRVPRVYL